MPTATTASLVPTEMTALRVLPEQTARWVRRARLVRLVRLVRLGRRAPRVRRATLEQPEPTRRLQGRRVKPEPLAPRGQLVLRELTPQSQVPQVRPVRLDRLDRQDRRATPEQQVRREALPRRRSFPDRPPALETPLARPRAHQQ